jgi:hypothetical protein
MTWYGMEDIWPPIEFDAAEDAEIDAMGPAEIARYDAGIARMLRKDLELLGAMQMRVIGSPEVGRSRPSKSRRRP